MSAMASSKPPLAVAPPVPSPQNSAPASYVAPPPGSALDRQIFVTICDFADHVGHGVFKTASRSRPAGPVATELRSCFLCCTTARLSVRSADLRDHLRLRQSCRPWRLQTRLSQSPRRSRRHRTPLLLLMLHHRPAQR